MTKTTQTEHFQPDFMRYEGEFPVLSGVRVAIAPNTPVKVLKTSAECLVQTLDEPALYGYVPSDRLTDDEPPAPGQNPTGTAVQDPWVAEEPTVAPARRGRGRREQPADA
ncbi:hypothetical protein IQ268_08500 [Oculatella sp. LEGE 06141]|uniref:hypothetical protein n=1 Tax=Oculatella sp. LEGE 06141 TaxID=1828648 RepID=UPI00187E1985|nr:hypothetical protein [Oculatella sp. LEGE 06141]MBE9178597.1 hypothetical protein [Oculatella sp. LEGE 06141]